MMALCFMGPRMVADDGASSCCSSGHETFGGRLIWLEPSWSPARRSAPRSLDRYVVDAEGGDERDVGGGAEADDDRLAGESREDRGAMREILKPD